MQFSENDCANCSLKPKANIQMYRFFFYFFTFTLEDVGQYVKKCMDDKFILLHHVSLFNQVPQILRKNKIYGLTKSITRIIILTQPGSSYNLISLYLVTGTCIFGLFQIFSLAFSGILYGNIILMYSLSWQNNSANVNYVNYLLWKDTVMMVLQMPNPL
jgi:hypothetical protein